MDPLHPNALDLLDDRNWRFEKYMMGRLLEAGMEIKPDYVSVNGEVKDHRELTVEDYNNMDLWRPHTVTYNTNFNRTWRTQKMKDAMGSHKRHYDKGLGGLEWDSERASLSVPIRGKNMSAYRDGI
jgi:hypothetical protein